MATKLYVIPGSHPAMAARLMLDYKGIQYDRVDLLPVISRVVLGISRFPSHTVPALIIGERRVQGTLNISRALDEIQPGPALFPADASERALVEEAERWGEAVLQPMVRTTLWACFKRNKEPMRSFSEGAKLPIPIGIGMKTAAPLIWIAGWYTGGRDDDKVRHYFAELPSWLDKIDGWIATGVLNGEQLNAADFQIATSTRLLMALDDIRPAIKDRPAGEHALRVVPSFPGQADPVFPAAWLKPLRSRPAPERTA